jgi:hypothetical protein
VSEWGEAMAPWIPVLGALAGAVVVGLFAMHNRRAGNEETKMPTVAETWLREERQALQLAALHTAYARLRATFAGYVYRARNGGPLEPTDTEAHYLIASSVDAIVEQKEA